LIFISCPKKHRTSWKKDGPILRSYCG